MFHQHFDIRQTQPVLGHNSFLRWANSFKTKLNIVKTKPSGPARSARTPEDIARVKMNGSAQESQSICEATLTRA